jgi:hypothetical protein
MKRLLPYVKSYDDTCITINKKYRFVTNENTYLIRRDTGRQIICVIYYTNTYSSNPKLICFFTENITHGRYDISYEKYSYAISTENEYRYCTTCRNSLHQNGKSVTIKNDGRDRDFFTGMVLASYFAQLVGYI